MQKHKYLILSFILAVEIFALFNRGGGPLLSHLFLTGIIFLCISILLIFEKNARLPPSYPALFYGLFFLCFSISLIASVTPEFGLSEFLLFANAGILLFILSSTRFSQRDLNVLSIGFIIVALIDTLIGYFIYTQNAFPRFAGTFIDLSEPHTAFGNDFANFLLLIIPLSLWQFLKKHKRLTTTLVTGLATAILLSGFILTFSRGAWLAAFVICMLVLLWEAIQWRRGRAVGRLSAGADSDVPVQQNISLKMIVTRTVVLILATSVLVGALQLARSQRFPTISLFYKATLQADEGSASVNERIEFWKGALKIIKNQPLFGNGVLSFKYLFPRYQTSFGANWDHPHNIFLKIGVENGIFAVVFFGIFLVSIAIISIRFLWIYPWHPTLFFLIGALGALGHNLVDFNFIVSNFTLFILSIGVALSFASSKGQISEKQPLASYFYRGIAVVSFFLLLLAIHEGFYNIDFKKGRKVLREKKLDEAIVRLENARNLIFERDLVNYLAIAYREKYKETKHNIWLIDEKHLILSKAYHTIDATLSSRVGEFYMEDKKPKTARKWFLGAIQTDPVNRFKYYYQFFEAEKTLGYKEFNASILKQVIPLLKEYKQAIKENRHMTILTDNPLYASRLFELLGMKEDQAEIDQLKFQELIKFTMKYGPVQNISF